MNRKKAKHLSTIDIVKGIAIWMIILVHSRQKIPNLSPCLKIFDIGQMGCQMFFVVSGFSAMMSYEKIASQKNPTWIFYKKRLATIIPGWYASIFIVYLLNTISLATFGETIGFATNRNPIAILCNLLLLQGLLPFCNNDVCGGGMVYWDTCCFLPHDSFSLPFYGKKEVVYHKTDSLDCRSSFLHFHHIHLSYDKA